MRFSSVKNGVQSDSFLKTFFSEKTFSKRCIWIFLQTLLWKIFLSKIIKNFPSKAHQNFSFKLLPAEYLHAIQIQWVFLGQKYNDLRNSHLYPLNYCTPMHNFHVCPWGHKAMECVMQQYTFRREFPIIGYFC